MTPSDDGSNEYELHRVFVPIAGVSPANRTLLDFGLREGWATIGIAEFLPVRIWPLEPLVQAMANSRGAQVTIDLHGYHPRDIVRCAVLRRILQQAWEMGEASIWFIHGHGRNRGLTPGFVNTNTGFFGLEIRRALRNEKDLRPWIHHTTLDCSDMGVTGVRLKRNPSPTRAEFDSDLIPDALVTHQWG